jgi:Protein of unknown function (DUF3987)
VTEGKNELTSLAQTDADNQAAPGDTSVAGEGHEDQRATPTENVLSEQHPNPQTSQEEDRKPPFPDFEPAGGFPIDALPESIQAAVREACKNDKVPGPIAVQSALSVVSLACQDLILVERMEGVRSVASLFMLAVAGSGVRKTQVDNSFLASIHEYDELRDKEHGGAVERDKIELLANKFKERVLQGKLKKLLLDDASEEEIGRVTGQLRVVQLPMKKRRLKRLLYSQISPATLERRLQENWPAAGLFSNEAGDILGTRRPEDLSRLDRLWEGQPIDVERSDEKERVYVADPRVTMSLMIQPSVFDRFLERKGEQARGIGFLARLLICRPDSLFGRRIIDPEERRSTFWLEEFNSRIALFLHATHSIVSREGGERIILRFSPEAQKLWIDDYNENEIQMRDGEEFAHETDFGSRYSEHVARLAALFYFFQEWDGRNTQETLQIPPHYLRNAIKVCQWYRQQFRVIFNPKLALERTANQVVDALLEILLRESWMEVELQFFMKRVPKHVRKKAQFDPVREWLEDNQIMTFYRKVDSKSGREAGPEYVMFHFNSKETKQLSQRRGGGYRNP